MTTYTGDLNARNVRLVIVASRFNELIVNALTEGALEWLEGHELPRNQIDFVSVPGAHEIPLAAKMALDTGRYDAVVCLGAVIRGATTHFDYVAGGCASGLQSLQMDTGMPVIFGVLATETVDQAMDRAGGKHGNRGAEAAAAAIEMLNLAKRLET